jgi:hypothetical protein
VARGWVRAFAVTIVIVAALSIAGCGSGQRQDAHAKSGTWNVIVEGWVFPKHQYLGTPTNFILRIRNVDTADIPQLALTVGGLKTHVDQPGAASPIRPIWLTTTTNYAQVTPYNSPTATTFNLGPLPAGGVKNYVVNLTPLRRGHHEVSYSLAGNLFGDAKIVDSRTNTPAADTRNIFIDTTPQFDEKVFDN